MPGIVLSLDELKAKLSQKIETMRRAANYYDKGFEGEAETLATALRVLFHDTNKSKSLIKAIWEASGQNPAYDKWAMGFYDTSGDVDPANLAPHDCFILKAMYPDGLRYIAPLDDSPFAQGKKLTFDDWWEKVVFVDGKYRNRFTRGKIVRVVANQDGGAHVGIELDEEYYKLTRENSMQDFWGVDRSGVRIDMQEPHNQPAFPAVRQITHEALKSLYEVFPECYREPYASPALSTRDLGRNGEKPSMFLTGAAVTPS